MWIYALPLPSLMRRAHNKLRESILGVLDIFYPMFRRIMPLQTYRYAACGGINTLIDITLFFISYNFIFKKQIFDLGPVALSPHIAALLFSFIITFPVGFYLSRYVVWQQTSTRKRTQLFRYLLVVIACMLLNYVFLKLFVDLWGWYPTPSKILITVIVVAFSYFTQRNFSFKENTTKE
ncbi:MAG: GtrA family protein [Chitinophagaceae bacterium]|nr:GtrA family protein [Chitinophagaceae bacterium]